VGLKGREDSEYLEAPFRVKIWSFPWRCRTWLRSGTKAGWVTRVQILVIFAAE
jgi:hypothetical protein